MSASIHRHPAWFGVVMGTGAVSLVLSSPAVHRGWQCRTRSPQTANFPEYPCGDRGYRARRLGDGCGSNRAPARG